MVVSSDVTSVSDPVLGVAVILVIALSPEPSELVCSVEVLASTGTTVEVRRLTTVLVSSALELSCGSADSATGTTVAVLMSNIVLVAS